MFYYLTNTHNLGNIQCIITKDKLNYKKIQNLEVRPKVWIFSFKQIIISTLQINPII